MDEITERDSVYMFNAEYWYDDLPTRDTSAQELIDALNADAYAQQIEVMVHEAEPRIAALACQGAALMLTNPAQGKQYGTQAQALFDKTRARIEREAGV